MLQKRLIFCRHPYKKYTNFLNISYCTVIWTTTSHEKWTNESRPLPNEFEFGFNQSCSHTCILPKTTISCSKRKRLIFTRHPTNNIPIFSRMIEMKVKKTSRHNHQIFIQRWLTFSLWHITTAVTHSCLTHTVRQPFADDDNKM